MSGENPGQRFGVNGRPLAEREAKPRDEAELVEATAEPDITVTAPRSVR